MARPLYFAKSAKNSYSYEEAQTLASCLKEAMPQKVAKRVCAGERPWALLADQSTAKLGLRDIERNFHVLRALIVSSPVRVPSTYLLADTMLIMDQMFDSKVLQSTNKPAEAIAEAMKMKSLLGKVRRHKRRSTKSRSKPLQTLKELVLHVKGQCKTKAVGSNSGSSSGSGCSSSSSSGSSSTSSRGGNQADEKGDCDAVSCAAVQVLAESSCTARYVSLMHRKY